ncbi:MAG: hypothetical protein DMG97_38385 [Acidobacteria bacterium]|nr:MAG: hypothetical protein DMG97_38385 [Acidobacteriota bacterium]
MEPLVRLWICANVIPCVALHRFARPPDSTRPCRRCWAEIFSSAPTRPGIRAPPLPDAIPHGLWVVVQAVRLQDFSGFGVNTVGELAHNCQGFPDLFTKPPGAMLSGEYMKNL